MDAPLPGFVLEKISEEGGTNPPNLLKTAQNERISKIPTR